MRIDLGPFAFHISERTTRRILPLLPFAPSFYDVKKAISIIEAEDREREEDNDNSRQA